MVCSTESPRGSEGTARGHRSVPDGPDRQCPFLRRSGPRNPFNEPATPKWADRGRFFFSPVCIRIFFSNSNLEILASPPDPHKPVTSACLPGFVSPLWRPLGLLAWTCPHTTPPPLLLALAWFSLTVLLLKGAIMGTNNSPSLLSIFCERDNFPRKALTIFDSV